MSGMFGCQKVESRRCVGYTEQVINLPRYSRPCPVREWVATLEIRPLFITPGSPLENCYVESFNGKIRNELLNGEVFYSLKETQVINAIWRKHWNTVRPHSALGYRPPAPETLIPTSQVPLFVLTL